MLLKYSSYLLQSDGEIIDRRLNEILGGGEQVISAQVGESLCELAQREGKRIGVSVNLPAQLISLVEAVGKGLGWKVRSLTPPEDVAHDLSAYDLVIVSTEEEIRALDSQGDDLPLSKRGLAVSACEVPQAQQKVFNHLRTVGPDSLVWERKPDLESEVPRIIHLFGHHSSGRWRRAIAASLRQTHPGWIIRYWTPHSLMGWLERERPEFLKILNEYPTDEHRMLAGRWIVLSHYGGVVISRPVIGIRPADEIFRWQRLALQLCQGPNGKLDVSDDVVASTASHPFWNGLFEALQFNRYKPIEQAVGAVFLQERMKHAVEMLSQRDWPTILNNDLVLYHPRCRDWEGLALQGMWDALRCMYQAPFLTLPN